MDKYKLPDTQGVTDSQKQIKFQVVVDSLTLPKNSKEYATDLDGDGNVDNKLGALLGSLSVSGLTLIDIQKQIDNLIGQGLFLLILSGNENSQVLPNDPGFHTAIHIEVLQGEDLDSNPNDNFSGSEELGINKDGFIKLNFLGYIDNGSLRAGPGKLYLPFPLLPSSELIEVQKASFEAKLSIDGLHDGRIYGAIDWQYVEKILIPQIALLINGLYQNPSKISSIKIFIGAAFDTNKDGKISEIEVRNSALLKLILAPDIDLNGDGIADAMSMGIAFSAINCVIISI